MKTVKLLPFEPTKREIRKEDAITRGLFDTLHRLEALNQPFEPTKAELNEEG